MVAIFFIFAFLCIDYQLGRIIEILQEIRNELRREL